MISYGKQSIDQSDIDSIVDVLKGDWLTQGPYVDAFEHNLNNYFGSKYACAVSSGTAALHLTGLALGWKPGDVIITSPITFLATANSIVYTGATPDFVDINSKTYNLDPDLIEAKINNYHSEGKTVKAIIGVDFAGHPCDWKSLREISDKYGLKLINDNCHGMGASMDGDKKYAIKYADVVTQSYHPVKHITTGEGGAILTNDLSIDDEVRQLRSHGMTKKSDQLEKKDGPWYYEMHEPGFNYRITDLQCALGSNQLKKLNFFVEKRKAIAKIYDEAFSDIEYFQIPNIENKIDHSYHLYPLKINFDKLSISKIDFFLKMKNSGVNLQVHYIPIHLQPFYRRKYGFIPGQFPKSEEFYVQEVSLPIYPMLKDENVKNISKNIINILIK